MAEEAVDEVTKNQGYLRESLSRGNKEIREFRGEAIFEDIQTVYKRKIEDLQADVKSLTRSQDYAFDFSPNNSQSLVMGKELDAREILRQDFQASVDIRNKKIEMNIMVDRYNHLFGHTYERDNTVK